MTRLQRNLAMGFLALVTAACTYVLFVQALLLFVPLGSWQWPGIARVTVLEVSNDPQNLSMDPVRVQQGEHEHWILMLKAEAAELEPDEAVWVLNNIHPTPLRPAQFRLTPQRLLMEYPEPLLILAIWGLRRLRRAQVKAELEARPPVRRVFTDDFHARSRRFASAAAQDPGGEEEEAPDQAKDALHCEPHNPEGQQQDPDQRIQH